MCIRITIGVAFACLFVSAAGAQEPRPMQSRIVDQTQVSLTVYSNGRSMVRDRRKMSFEKGRILLEVQDVSAQMRSETAQFKSLSGADDLTVLEQNLEYDLLSPQKMLEKYLGKTVSVIRTHPTTGAESTEAAEVLAVQNGVVLKMKDRVETGIPGRISFSEVPATLRAQPTLSLLIDSKKRGEQEVELNYQTGGISWKADYSAELNQDEKSTYLTGLVTLTNQSGTSFRNAQLQLMAGDVQTVDQPSYRNAMALRSMEMPLAEMGAAADSVAIGSDAFFEYHLYTLPRSTSVMTGQSKQVTLLQAPDVKSKKELVFTTAGQDYFTAGEDFFPEDNSNGDGSPDDADLGTPINGGVFLIFENDKEAKLGMPLPSGIVRVYKKDKSGLSQFLGEDTIRHTPEGERVRVKLGRSFDVTGRRKRTSFKSVVPGAPMKKMIRVSETGVRVTFKNAKAVAQRVIYREVIPGEWKMLSSSHDYKKISKDNAEWQIAVPAKGQVSVVFRVQVALAR